MPVPNPKGTAVSEMVCANLHGGVCRQQVLLDSVNAPVKSTYDVLKSKGIRRADLPIVDKLGWKPSKIKTDVTKEMIADYQLEQMKKLN